MSKFLKVLKNNEINNNEFYREEAIIRWLYLGDTLYEVNINNNKNIIEIENSITPHSILKAENITLINPQTITDELALELYKKSQIPNGAYPKALASTSLKSFQNTAFAILKERISEKNINYAITEWNDFFNNDVNIEKNEFTKYVEETLYEIRDDRLITLFIDREPIEKRLSNDNIINIAGQSGAGKTYYSALYKNNSNYIVIDTDEIFSEGRFNNSIGINKELGEYFRLEYNTIPELSENFDKLYKEMISYCNRHYEGKTIVIDSSLFHTIKNISLLKGKIVILRTCMDTCYKRCIDRFKNKNPEYSEENLNNYINKKKKIFKYYRFTNEFIKKIDLI